MNLIENQQRSDFLVAKIIECVRMRYKTITEREKMQKIIYMSLVLFAIVLCACGTVYEKAPVGIGPEYSELKKSPCACLELKKAPEVPEWFS